MLQAGHGCVVRKPCAIAARSLSINFKTRELKIILAQERRDLRIVMRCSRT